MSDAPTLPTNHTEQAVAKTKRQLTEAQQAALKKGREALAAKRRAATAQTESNELVHVEDLPFVHNQDDIFFEKIQETCLAMMIVLLSYLIMFIVLRPA